MCRPACGPKIKMFGRARPIVALTANLSSKHDFPTPESPINSSCEESSGVRPALESCATARHLEQVVTVGDARTGMGNGETGALGSSSSSAATYYSGFIPRGRNAARFLLVLWSCPYQQCERMQCSIDEGRGWSAACLIAGDPRAWVFENHSTRSSTTVSAAAGSAVATPVKSIPAACMASLTHSGTSPLGNMVCR